MRHSFAVIASLCVATFTANGSTIFGDLESNPPNTVYTDWIFAAQSFTVPDVDSFLISWTFDLDARADGGTLAFSIHSFDGGVIGDDLFRRSVERTATAGLVTVPIGIALTPMARYVAMYDSSQALGTHVIYMPSNVYPNGSPSLGYSMSELQGNFAMFLGAETRFQAEFGTVPPPPELEDPPAAATPEPATLCLTGLALLAGVALHRRFR